MRPDLTPLSEAGAVLEQAEWSSDLSQNSIRHLALTSTGVAFALQWQCDTAEPVPLLGLWTPGTTPRLCDSAPEDVFVLQGYADAIAAISGPDRRHLAQGRD